MLRIYPPTPSIAALELRLNDVQAMARPWDTVRSAVAPSTRAASVLAALVAAGGAALATAEPTAIPELNTVYRVLAAVAIVAVGARASRWTWSVALLPAVTTPDPLVVIGVVAAVVIGSRAARTANRSDIVAVGSVVMAITVQIVFRLDSVGPYGFTTVAVAGCLAPSVYSGLARLSVDRRRTVWTVVAVVATIWTVCLVASTVAVMNARDATVAAVRMVDQASVDGAAGDLDAARLSLADASQALYDAQDDVDSVSGRLATIVPGVGWNSQAINRLLANTGAVVDAADVTLRRLDRAQERNYRPEPVARASMAAADLSRQVEQLHSVLDDLGSLGVLEPTLRESVREVAARVEPIGPGIDRIRAALDVVPDLLGHQGARRYAVVLANPAESREVGGVAAAVAMVDVRDGDIIEHHVLRARDLGAPESAITTELPRRYRSYEPWRYGQNLTGARDFDIVASTTAKVIEAMGSGTVDGVIYLDPQALAGLIELVGPVWVPELAAEVDADEIEELLVRDQYRLFPERRDRVAVSESLLDATVDRLEVGDLAPEELVVALGDAAGADRLRFSSRQPKVAAALSAPRDPAATDFLSVMQVNTGPNKLDAELHREIDYEVRIDNDHHLTATTTVSVENRATARTPGGDNLHGLPPGTNSGLVVVYTPHAVTESRTKEGDPIDSYGEGALWRHEVAVALAPGQQRSVTLSLDGLVEPGPYRLHVDQQPLVNPDRLRVDASVPRGRSQQAFDRLDRDVTVVVD